MIVLTGAALVYLEVPKTATMAMRAMLRPLKPKGGWPFPEAGRHLGGPGYDRHWRAQVEALAGRPVETFCVVREPLARAESWYRYRQRAAVAGQARSSAGMTFAAFLAHTLDPDPPMAARIGRQDRFCGYDGQGALIDHIFDYRRLDLVTAFVGGRVGRVLELPQRNVSPAVAAPDPAAELPAALIDRHRHERAPEYELYERVAAVGHWRPAVSSSAR